MHLVDALEANSNITGVDEAVAVLVELVEDHSQTDRLVLEQLAELFKGDFAIGILIGL